MRFEDRVHKFEYKLTDTDDQIIEYIQKNKHDFVNQSIQNIAATLLLSPIRLQDSRKSLGMMAFPILKAV